MALLLRLKGDRVNPTGPVLALNGYVQKKARGLLKRCVKALEQEYPDLRDMTDLKSLRHYYASVCVMAGIDYKTIALWLGHNASSRPDARRWLAPDANNRAWFGQLQARRRSWSSAASTTF